MKKKDIQTLATVLGSLGFGMAAASRIKRAQGSPAFGPKVSNYLGFPETTISFSEGEMVEQLAKPGVDISNMWRLAAESTYPTGDMILIAIREALQNSLDAIEIRREKDPYFGDGLQYEDSDLPDIGQFFVTWVNKEDGSVDLILQDNGIGMSAEDIKTRFMVLGAKGVKTQTSRGGFGFAKAAILFLSQNFEFEVRTRNLVYASGKFGGESYIRNYVKGDNDSVSYLPYRAGTMIILKNIQLDFINKYTNMVVGEDLSSSNYRSSGISVSELRKEYDRISNFLSLNLIDPEKMNLTFIAANTTGAGDVSVVWQSKRNENRQALDWLLETLDENYEFDISSYDFFRNEIVNSLSKQQMLEYSEDYRVFAVNNDGSPKAISIMAQGDDIVEYDKPQFWGLGSEFKAYGFSQEDVDIPKENTEESQKLYAIIAIRGQVQFVKQYYINLQRKLPFALLYIDLFPSVPAVDKNYPLDLSRLALKDDEKLRKLVKNIQTSTEQVQDLYDAFYYKCAPLDILSFTHQGLQSTNDYSDRYGDEKYKIIGTNVGYGYNDSISDQWRSEFDYVVLNRRGQDFPEILTSWEIDEWKTEASGTIFNASGQVIDKEIDKILGSFSFLKPFIVDDLSKERWRNRAPIWKGLLINLWVLQNVSTNVLQELTRYEGGLSSEQMTRISALGFTIGSSGRFQISPAKAKKAWQLFCPFSMDADVFYPFGRENWTNMSAVLWGATLFNFYIHKNYEIEKFLYQVSLVRSKLFFSALFAEWSNTADFWASTQRTFIPFWKGPTTNLSERMSLFPHAFNPKVYFDHVSLVKKVISKIKSSNKLSELAIFDDTIWANPLFGIANLRCDYGRNFSILSNKMGGGLTALFIWFASVYECVFALKFASSNTLMKEPIQRIVDTLNTYYSLNIAIVFDDPNVMRRGKKKTSIPMAANRGSYGEHTLMINPYLWETLTQKTKDANTLAILLLRTIAHELTHQDVMGHNEQFVMTDSEMFEQLVLLGVPLVMANLIPIIDTRIAKPKGSKSQMIKSQKKAIERTKNYRFSCSRS